MKAAVLRGGKMAFRDDVPEPLPGPGQVLVNVRACGICGSDLHFAAHGEELVTLQAQLQGLGEASPSARIDLHSDIFMGHEFCAEVAKAGPGTEAPAPGTLVTSMPYLLADTRLEPILYSNSIIGGYAESMLLAAPLLLIVPNGLDAHHAALTEPLAVGLHAVNKASIMAGEIALVIGCGPIGIAIIAALRYRGIEHIVAADFSPARRLLAAKVGAHRTVDPTRESAFDVAAPDVVFEAAGVSGVLADVVRRAPRNTRIVMAGAGTQPDSVLPFFATVKELSIQFAFAYESDEFAESLHALAEGLIDVGPMITGTTRLEEVDQAFAELERADQHCKVVVTP